MPDPHSLPQQHHVTEEDIGPVRAAGLVVLGMLLFWPRAVLAAFAIFDSHLIRDAFDGWLVPIVGWFVLPWTTLAYAGMWSISSDAVSGWEWAVVVLAIPVDLWTWSAFRR